MQILQTTVEPGYPLSTGGSNRMHGLMKGRRDGDTICRFAHSGERKSAPNPKILDNGYREHHHRSYVQGVIGHLTRLPQIYISTLMRLKRLPLLTDWLAISDLVFVHRPWQVPYVKKKSEKPLVYVSHVFELELFDHLSSSPIGEYLRKRVKAFEQTAVDAADLIVSVSERDRNQYESTFDIATPFFIAPPAAHLEDVPDKSVVSDFDPDSTLTAIFVGSTHWPNIEAVQHILEVAGQNEIRQVDIQFLIAGNVCSKFEQTAVPESVKLLGFVDSLEDYYEQSDLALNPVTTGAGANIKVPEYFAHGLPVLTTPFGARGIIGEEGKHLLIRERDEFDETLLAAHAGEFDSRMMAGRAQQLVREELNWTRISQDLFDKIAALDIV